MNELYPARISDSNGPFALVDNHAVIEIILKK